MTIMDEKVTIMVHKTNGEDSVVYYLTNLPSWGEVALMFASYSIIAMAVFYVGYGSRVGICRLAVNTIDQKENRVV